MNTMMLNYIGLEWLFQLAVEKLMRTQNKEFQDLCKQPEDTRSTDDPVVHYGHGMLALYQHLISHFGDTLSVQLPVLELDKVFGGQPSYDYISLGDCESKRSGEELLSDLMHQVQQQEQEHRHSQQQHQCLDIRKMMKLPTIFSSTEATLQTVKLMIQNLCILQDLCITPQLIQKAWSVGPASKSNWLSPAQ